jgi:hypothetical protein
VRPTRSYELDVPQEVQEDVDEQVASYWLPGKSGLLQVSSTTRVSGEQVAAGQRLTERLSSEQLTDVREEVVDVDACPDVAAASGFDAEGTRWLYCYAVWPDLAILATVSGDRTELQADGNWPWATLASLRRVNWPM